jgi:ABC-2 type transport system permease protein
MSAALRAEWTKLRTLGETWWLTAGASAVAVAASAGMAASTHVSPGGPGGGPDPTKLALTGIDLGQAVIAVLAVVAITEEYGTGMIRVSIAAIPRRQALLGAKAINVVGLTLAAAVPAVAGCLLAGRLLLPGAGLNPAHGYTLVSIGHGPTLRAALGGLLYLALIALLSLGIGAIVRETAVATGVVLGLLYLPPLLALLLSGPWRRHLEQIAPMTAGLSIEATQHLRSLPDAPWTGLGILAAWAAGALLAGGALLRTRDA